jgi:hypothetical protein
MFYKIKTISIGIESGKKSAPASGYLEYYILQTGAVLIVLLFLVGLVLSDAQPFAPITEKNNFSLFNKLEDEKQHGFIDPVFDHQAFYISSSRYARTVCKAKITLSCVS